MANIKADFRPPRITKIGIKICWHLLSNGGYKLLIHPLLLMKILSMKLLCYIEEPENKVVKK